MYNTTKSNQIARAIMEALPHESNPHAPLRLLSLDGGGVRGLSSLMILDDLMENIAQEEKRLKKRPLDDDEPLKPCEYFDLIGGTSTGGIIAVLLGRLRLNCRQCIEIYRKLARTIFEKDRSLHLAGIKVPMGSTRFSGAVLEAAIKSALEELGYDKDELMWDDSLFEEHPNSQDKRDSIWNDAVPEIITESPTQVKSLRDSSQSKQKHDNLPSSTSQEQSKITTKQNNNVSFQGVDSAPKDSKPDPSRVTPVEYNNSYPSSSTHSDQDASQPSPSDATSLKDGSKDRPDYGTVDLSSIKPLAKNHQRTPTWKIHPRTSVHVKPDQKGCRAFVVSSMKNALGLPRLLSTYDPNDRQTRIWEALRATSAAPTFFEEMTFGTPRVTYLDGGVGFNNPTAEVDYAAKSIWPGRSTGIIISVGTGLQTIPSVGKIRSWLPFGLGTDIALASALANMATGTARVDNEMQRMYYDSGTRYFRFDVDGGLSDISLEQWMKEDEMAALTEAYMRDPQQQRRAHQFGELMIKLSALPPEFQIDAMQFSCGIDAQGLVDGSFVLDELDFKTGYPMGVTVNPEDMTPSKRTEIRESSPSGHPGIKLETDRQGRLRKILPIPSDLDADGRREEARILTCVKADNVCLRVLRRGIPKGKYRVRFILCFYNTEYEPPTELILSVGRPFDATTFNKRFVDVKITEDIVPVLLYPDAVRLRIGRRRYSQIKGKGWVELTGDVEVEVGLEGTLGIVISKKYREGEFVGGWSFGGVKLEPVFDVPVKLL